MENKPQIEAFVKSIYNAFPLMDITVRYTYDTDADHWFITHDYPREWSDLKALKLGELSDTHLNKHGITNYSFKYEEETE